MSRKPKMLTPAQVDNAIRAWKNTMQRFNVDIIFRKGRFEIRNAGENSLFPVENLSIKQFLRMISPWELF